MMCAAALVVIALDRERKSRLETEHLSKEVESLAKQLERTRITREIHDVIGHSLTSLRIQLEVASKYASLDEVEARIADGDRDLPGTRQRRRDIDLSNGFRAARAAELDGSHGRVPP